MVKLFLNNSNLCDHNSPTSQTDRQTDSQTTCDRNTALCTKVHRAVKTDSRRLQRKFDPGASNLLGGVHTGDKIDYESPCIRDKIDQSRVGDIVVTWLKISRKTVNVKKTGRRKDIWRFVLWLQRLQLVQLPVTPAAVMLLIACCRFIRSLYSSEFILSALTYPTLTKHFDKFQRSRVRPTVAVGRAASEFMIN